jgi:hypothetical protein
MESQLAKLLPNKNQVIKISEKLALTWHRLFLLPMLSWQISFASLFVQKMAMLKWTKRLFLTLLRNFIWNGLFSKNIIPKHKKQRPAKSCT